MPEKKQKKGLGRGLSALLNENQPTIAATADRTAPIDKVHPNPDQPRRIFPPAELDDLARSITEKGVIQPLLVRPHPERSESWQIIAGERRWRAAQAAGLHEVPVIVRDLDDAATLEIAIIENVQRSDLNPIDEAGGYKQLLDRFGYSQAHLAETIGKSRPHVANMLRLLTLPEDVRIHVENGTLTAGHARALVNTHDPSALARKVVAEGLSVRQTEMLAKPPRSAKTGPRRVSKDADTRALENDLSAATGLNVSIAHKGERGGAITIRYKDLDQLDGICRLLSG